MSESKMDDRDNLKLHSHWPEGKVSRRDLLKLAAPLGKVTLDATKCTACSLCASDCPTGALTVSVSEESDAWQILFKHNLCVACGQCVELCPEQCLSLERTLEPDRIINPPVVLFEDRVSRCRDCGNPIGSRAMINRLQVKLVAGDFLASQFELCPECKTKQLILGRKGNGHTS